MDIGNILNALGFRKVDSVQKNSRDQKVPVPAESGSAPEDSVVISGEAFIRSAIEEVSNQVKDEASKVNESNGFVHKQFHQYESQNKSRL